MGRRERTWRIAACGRSVAQQRYRVGQLTSVGKAVRKEHVRRAACENANAASDDQAITCLPVETEARLERATTVERGGVGKADAREEVGVERWLFVVVVQVITGTEIDLQRVGYVPIVLKAERVRLGAEEGSGILGVARRNRTRQC